MKKILVTLMFLSGFYISNGQSILLGTVSSGGGNVSGASSQISFTAGETISGTVRNSNVILTQGFQQSLFTYWTGKINTAWEESRNWNGPYPGPKTDIFVLAVPNALNVNSNVYCRRFYARPGSVIVIHTGFQLNILRP